MAIANVLSGSAAQRPGLVLIAASLGVLVAQIDTSVVTLAVKAIGADLGARVSGMQWMIDAYNLTYAALLLTGGALGDRYGRRRVYLGGLALFAVGSTLCALASTTAMLLVGRALAGVGAALELPMSLVLVALAYPEKNARQRALGVWASCNGLAFVVGPTVGGLLVETFGWRSVFYLILPFCAAAALLAFAAMEESRSAARHKLDLPGQIAAVAALGGLAFLAIEGAHLGWTSLRTLFAAAATAGGAAALFCIERRIPDGLVPFALFRNRAFSAALVIAALMTFGMYALLFLVPLYFQTVRGETVVLAGVHMLPLSIAFFAVSQWNGRIVHALGVRASMAWGMAAMGVGELALVVTSGDTSFGFIAAAFVITGIGLGLNTAPVNHVAVANAQASRSGTASGLVNTARMIGATFGVAVLGAVFARFAGEAPDASTFLGGLRPALALGALAELGGAAIAFVAIR